MRLKMQKVVIRSYYDKEISTGCVTLDNEDIFYLVTNFSIKVCFSFMQTEWRAFYRIENIHNNPTIPSMKDNYNISLDLVMSEVFGDFGIDLMRMLTQDITLPEVYRFLIRNEWLSDRTLTRMGEEHSENNLGYSDVSAMMSPEAIVDMNRIMYDNLVNAITSGNVFRNFEEIKEEVLLEEEDKLQAEDVEKLYSNIPFSSMGILDDIAGLLSDDTMDKKELDMEDILPMERASLTSIINILISKVTSTVVTVDVKQIIKYQSLGINTIYSVIFKQIEEQLMEILERNDIKESFTLLIYSKVVSLVTGLSEQEKAKSPLYLAGKFSGYHNKFKPMVHVVSSIKMDDSIRSAETAFDKSYQLISKRK